MGQSVKDMNPEDQKSTKSAKPRAKGLRRVCNAIFYSMEGIGSTLKHEEAFRQEVFASIILIPLAIILPIDLTAKLLLIGSFLLVFIVELLNTAIEVAIDYISEYDHHFLAKRAKDMASGAVFLSLLNGAIIWFSILAANRGKISLWMTGFFQ